MFVCRRALSRDEVAIARGARLQVSLYHGRQELVLHRRLSSNISWGGLNNRRTTQSRLGTSSVAPCPSPRGPHRARAGWSVLGPPDGHLPSQCQPGRWTAEGEWRSVGMRRAVRGRRFGVPDVARDQPHDYGGGGGAHDR